jgi:hypothetical protein
MFTLKAVSLWLLYSLGVIATAHPDSNDLGLKRLTLFNNEGTKLLSRQASDTCSGSCETCFGAGFELCDSSSTICYLPGDALYGEESCSATGTIDTSSDSSFPTTDTCENGGLSCAYCFGEGHISCPGAADYCYDPNNSTISCPGDTGTDSESTASDSDSASTATGSSDDSSSTFASSPTAGSDASTASTSGASSSDTADGVVGGSDNTDDSSSGTSTGSSSGTSGSNSNGDGNGNSNQGSSSNNNDANGDPIKKSSGNSVIREGLIGVLSAGGVALVAAWHLLI